MKDVTGSFSKWEVCGSGTSLPLRANVCFKYKKIKLSNTRLRNSCSERLKITFRWPKTIKHADIKSINLQKMLEIHHVDSWFAPVLLFDNWHDANILFARTILKNMFKKINILKSVTIELDQLTTGANMDLRHAQYPKYNIWYADLERIMRQTTSYIIILIFHICE